LSVYYKSILLTPLQTVFVFTQPVTKQTWRVILI